MATVVEAVMERLWACNGITDRLWSHGRAGPTLRQGELSELESHYGYLRGKLRDGSHLS